MDDNVATPKIACPFIKQAFFTENQPNIFSQSTSAVIPP